MVTTRFTKSFSSIGLSISIPLRTEFDNKDGPPTVDADVADGEAEDDDEAEGGNSDDDDDDNEASVDAAIFLMS